VSLSQQFLDALRARTTLSSLIGGTLKLEKAGREYKACCPFHGEKTPSFTINDEKGFYHCFGCGAHGDAIRWLVDQGGMAFMDAVRELAATAGLDVPARSEDHARRESAAAGVHDVLAAAAAWYSGQLHAMPAAIDVLMDRGLSIATIARFGLGLAPRARSVSACGVSPASLEAAGLLLERDGLLADRFRGRIMIPIHDARGRCVGFGGRATSEKQDPKYLNSPDADHFDKGRLLFNQHRAAPAARAAKRLVVVEGYFDVIALDDVGIAEAVAPMGTALTVEQLQRLWRIEPSPVLLFDGDGAGRRAAVRAAERALPMVGAVFAGSGLPATLSIAMMPEGRDPDDMARAPAEEDGGRDGIEAILAAAQPLSAFLWGACLREGHLATPEGKAGLWRRLAVLAMTIVDQETREQYLSDWRARFDAAFPPPPPGLSEQDMLPNGSVEGAARLSDQPEGVQVLLRRVSAAWLVRQMERMPATADLRGRLAWNIGRRVGEGLIEAAEWDALHDLFLEDCPDLQAEDLAKAFDAGHARGFDVAGLLLDMRCASFQRTDMGNAERFDARHGRDYLYTTAKGWLGWDSRRYRVLNQEKDTTPADVMAGVFETVRAIQREAAFIRDTGVGPPEEPYDAEGPAWLKRQWETHWETGSHVDGLDRWVQSGSKYVLLSELLGRWGRASEASGRIGCIANLAKRWVTVELKDFDTDQMLLNCRNGTLVFHRKGSAEAPDSSWVELRPHRREDMLTKLTACDYDPEADAPEWRKFVRWAQPQEARLRYLQQWMGYNLTGDIGEQIFHIWWGPTAANGKSTFGNACREAVGDYGDTIGVETFLDEGVKKRGDQATPDLVQLPGVRLLTSGEVPVGAKINEPLINTVTGGDPMNVRDNFRSFFRFMPIFKWTLWCNEKPDIPRGTEGIWRRVKVVMWESHLEPHEKDRELPKRLAAEHPGILAWMVRGLIDWMDNGFIEPEDVTVASADYKEDSDPLAAFLRLCTEPDPEARVQSSHLYELYIAWAKAAQEVEWKQKGFSRAMKGKGFTNKASNGMHWLGLRMVRRVSDFLDHDGKVREAIDVSTEPAAVDHLDSPPDDAWRPPPDDDFVPGWD
jgi:DNA primase catalytic core